MIAEVLVELVMGLIDVGLSLAADLFLDAVAARALGVSAEPPRQPSLSQQRRQDAADELLFVAFIVLAVGIAWGLLLPERMLAAGPFPGVSLILAPALVGGAMSLWGGIRRRMGRAPSGLATWYGGVLVGFFVALGRIVGMAIVHWTS